MSAVAEPPAVAATVAFSDVRCPLCERRWLAEGDWSDGYPLACPYCGEARPGVFGVHRSP